ncbi:MAG TPA: glutamate racemase [Deltaproteobacteria bacterium]|nr:glutamate racemase [Deltaproteobacteria bacterium]
MKTDPIGIFDSGIGGLTVLRAIARRLPGESTVYLGDTARVPYGTKSAETIIRYSLENARFLAGCDVKVVVAACNTASAYALGELSEMLDVPVIGVIEPGAARAVGLTRRGRIGVIGTEGTVRSGSYEAAIKRRRPDAEVVSRACPLFVPLAEEGWTCNEVAELTARLYLSALVEAGIDTLVLGCTHYPLLKETIGRVAGPEVRLVDSAEATALEVERLLVEKGLVCGGGEPERRFFVTDSPGRFAAVGRRFFGDGLHRAELVRLGG